MRKIRIFKSVESELGILENEINEWLESSGSQLISVTGNIAPQTENATIGTFSASDVLVIVVYETK